MKISRLAVPAIVAFSLAACSSSDNGTNGGTSSTARLQAYQKFSNAANHAAANGATGASLGFTFAGLAQLFGSSTATVNVSSNGQASLSIAGRPTQQLGHVPAFATAGSYTALGVSIRDITHYTGTNAFTDTTDQSMVIAYRDTTALIFGGGDLTSDQFGDNSAGSAEAFIYENPSAEWYATAGNYSLSGISTGGSCSIDATIRQALIAAYGNDNATFDCNNISSNVTLNVTASAPETASATGSRTASITASGLPGIRVLTTSTSSGTALRAGFLRHAR